MWTTWKDLLDSQTLAQLQDDHGLSEAATEWCAERDLDTLLQIRRAAEKGDGLRALGHCEPRIEAELLALLPTNAAAPRTLTNGLGVRGSYAMLPGIARGFLDNFLGPEFDANDLDRLVYSDLNFGIHRGCGHTLLPIVNAWRERMRIERTVLDPGRQIEHLREWVNLSGRTH